MYKVARQTGLPNQWHRTINRTVAGQPPDINPDRADSTGHGTGQCPVANRTLHRTISGATKHRVQRQEFHRTTFTGLYRTTGQAPDIHRTGTGQHRTARNLRLRTLILRESPLNEKNNGSPGQV